MEKTIKTRVSKDDKVATETKVTINFADVTREELESLAAATVIINEQAIWRTSGVIPATCTIKVREQLDRPRGGGFVATPESLAARAKKLTPEQRQALIEKLMEEE